MTKELLVTRASTAKEDVVVHIIDGSQIGLAGQGEQARALAGILLNALPWPVMHDTLGHWLVLGAHATVEKGFRPSSVALFYVPLLMLIEDWRGLGLDENYVRTELNELIDFVLQDVYEPKR